MEDSYRSSSDTHPLCALYKGNRKYSERFGTENAGGVLKYFRYTQKLIGNQASYKDLAKCANRKADLDGCTVGEKKNHQLKQRVPMVAAHGRQREVSRGKARLDFGDGERTGEVAQESQNFNL